LVSVSIPDRVKGEAETTDTDSTAREFIAGLRDSGTVEITVRYDPDDAGQLIVDNNYAAAQGSEVVAWVITLPGAATASPSPQGVASWSFDGYVQKPWTGSLDLVGDVAAELTCTVRVTGPVTVLH